MANTPKKVKDPTEVALSAIQEALNISDTAADTSRNATMRNEAAPAVPPVPPVFDEPSFEPRPAANERSTVFDAVEEPLSSRRPANDDRETIGQLPQALQQGFQLGLAFDEPGFTAQMNHRVIPGWYARRRIPRRRNISMWPFKYNQNFTARGKVLPLRICPCHVAEQLALGTCGAVKDKRQVADERHAIANCESVNPTV